MLFTVLGPFITSLFIAIFAIPVIIRVADLKHLMDEPDQDRKLHKTKTPTLGGVAIFAGCLFAYSSYSDYLHTIDVKFMIPALVLLFFAGIKDDILLLSPLKKLGIQFICAALLTVLGNLRLSSLWGMFGINEIHPFIGTSITFLLIVSLINAFNLIDGANGLAGGLGLIASLFFGAWFYATGSQSLTILSFSLAGSLLGFLFFNFRHAKIFMGDTGSMIIGFIISILAIKFIENNRLPGIETSAYYIKAAPAIALACVLIPLYDMSRVFFYRIISKRSPFSADRSHIHHLLIDIGLSHTKTSLILHAVSLFFILISLLFRDLRSLDLSLGLIALISALTFILIVNRKSKQKAPGKYNNA